MARHRPDLKIDLKFKNGKCFVISLYLINGGFLGRYFDVSFKDCDGKVTKNKTGCTVTKLIDRLRVLIVKEVIK